MPFLQPRLDGHTWIHIVGTTGSGKSVLLQDIVDDAVAGDERLLVYTFNPQGIGDEAIEDARRIEKSIYLLHRKCQDGLQNCKVFVAIHEWHLLFNLASDPKRLYEAILDIFRDSRKWGVVFGVATQTPELDPAYRERLRETEVGMYLKIVLGSRALVVARHTWQTTDARYRWLLQQERPCVICGSHSIRVAIVPEIQNKLNNKTRTKCYPKIN